MDRISVLIVTWNSAATILECLASIPGGVETVVVDNGSTDETVELITAHFPAVRLIENAKNLGFGAACNLAASLSSGTDFLLLNPDAALFQGALERLALTLEERPELGAVGPCLMDDARLVELSWGAAPTIGSEWRRQAEQQARCKRPELPADVSRVDWVSGACILVRGRAWRAIQGFDERYFLYFEDLDLCHRLRRASWGVAIDPLAKVLHRRGNSANQLRGQVAVWYRGSQLRYYATHNPPLQNALLRAYLALKYLRRAARGDLAAKEIVKLALGYA